MRVKWASAVSSSRTMHFFQNMFYGTAWDWRYVQFEHCQTDQPMGNTGW